MNIPDFDNVQNPGYLRILSSHKMTLPMFAKLPRTIRIILPLLAVAMAVSSCHFRFGGSGVARLDADVDLELYAYPVESGIGDRYSPLNLLLCSDEKWVLTARDIEDSGCAFFITSDKGKNWECRSWFEDNWMCGEIVMDKESLYCFFNDLDRIAETTVKSGKIMRSDDYGDTWTELVVFDGNVEHLIVNDGVIAVQLCVVSDKSGNRNFEVTHSIRISDDDGLNWRELRLTEPFVSSFSDGNIAAKEYGDSDKLLEISLSGLCTDTIHCSFKSAVQIVRGEDIVGVWNGGKADYFRIAGKTLTFASRIEYGSRLSDYIPEHIYQYGDLVYTSVLHPGLNQSEKMFVSNDRGKSWATVSTESEVDRQLDRVWTPDGDAWFMAGYKDRMVSYCVGYKGDRRQDFIKVVRPK